MRNIIGRVQCISVEILHNTNRLKQSVFEINDLRCPAKASLAERSVRMPE
jgi:hypothetical protein